MLNDLEHLPKIVTNIDGINDVLEAIEPEISSLHSEIRQYRDELVVKLTNKLIDRWEQDFSIQLDSSLSLEERRTKILNRLQNKRTLTFENLHKLIAANIPQNTHFTVINNPSEYNISVYVDLSDFSELQKVLIKSLPAYISLTIEEESYSLKTGTFRAGEKHL